MLRRTSLSSYEDLYVNGNTTLEDEDVEYFRELGLDEILGSLKPEEERYALKRKRVESAAVKYTNTKEEIACKRARSEAEKRDVANALLNESV